MIQIVCDHIDKDWKQLASFIGITEEVISLIDIKSEEGIRLKSETTHDSKMMMCFNEIKNDIKWKKLKIQLQKINRRDILKMIKNETLLTIGKHPVILMRFGKFCNTVYQSNKKVIFFLNSGMFLPVLYNIKYH